MSPTPLTIRQIRARAAKIVGPLAKRHTTRIRGYHSWDRGVTILESAHSGAVARVFAFYDRKEARDADLKRGIAQLRAAGWTVSDDGLITEIPPCAS